MRVISGKYKGKYLKGFDIDGTRPTMDRVKESLFSIIQLKIPDSICLDLFAGSGSLGIEALSNGSKACYFVDSNRQISDILEENLKNIDNGYIIKKDFKEALKQFDIKFDIVFLDPPYDKNLITPSIKLLLDYKLLNNEAIIICEYENETIDCRLKIMKEKKYGSKYIRIYKNELV